MWRLDRSRRQVKTPCGRPSFVRRLGLTHLRVLQCEEVPGYGKFDIEKCVPGLGIISKQIRQSIRSVGDSTCYVSDALVLSPTG